MAITTNWYDYPSNYSNGTAVDGLGNFFQYANYILNDYLGAALILMLWLATFIMSLVAGSRKAIAVASFITFLLSMYLVRLGMIHPVIVVTLVVLMIIGFLGGGKDSSL